MILKYRVIFFLLVPYAIFLSTVMLYVIYECHDINANECQEFGVVLRILIIVFCTTFSALEIA